MFYLYLVHPSLLYSRNLAFGFGILLPLMQTIRVWKHLTEPGYVIHWVDDYLFGGFLLFGAFKVLKYKEQGNVYLAAASGVMVGVAILSTLGQLEGVKQGKTYPAPVSTEMLLAIKLAGLVFCIAGMFLCFGAEKQ